MMSNAITSPIVSPAVFDQGPRGSTAVPNTANTRKNVVVASITMPLPARDALGERRRSTVTAS